jgi:prepilin-type processing-associated H-X9-DG protein
MRAVVQTLIVVVVLLLGGGLLLTFNARIRGAAARVNCTNNLKQIGLALHNYSSANRDQFPSATEPNPDLAPDRRLGWLVTIGPYMEATNLFVRMDRHKGWDTQQNRYLAFTAWKVYQCPGFADRPTAGTPFPTNYVGIAGLGEDAATLSPASPRAGFFGYDRKLTLADIEDRKSTLLAVLETAQVSGAWSAGGYSTARGLDEDDPPYLGRTGQFGGLHRGGVNALFADASVRLIGEAVDPGVLEEMATVAGSKDADPAGAD